MIIKTQCQKKQKTKRTKHLTTHEVVVVGKKAANRSGVEKREKLEKNDKGCSTGKKVRGGEQGPSKPIEGASFQKKEVHYSEGG